MKNPLKVGCILPENRCSAWVRAAIQEAQMIPDTKFVFFFVRDAGQHTKQGMRKRTLNWLDYYGFGKFEDPLKRVQVPTGEACFYGDAVQEALLMVQPDILMDFTGWCHNNSVPKVPLGVWEYRFSRVDEDIVTQLVTWQPEEEICLLLYQSTTAISPLSTTQNRSQVYWKCCWYMQASLQKIVWHGGYTAWTKKITDSGQQALCDSDFFVYKGIMKLLKFRFLEYRGRRDEWYLRLYNGKIGFDQLTSSAHKDIPLPGGAFWADPFLFEHEGKTWMFLEEFPYHVGKGHISVSEVFPDATLTQPIKIIEEEWHLSYPFVFTFREKLYLIPESSSTKTIELYVCEEFPGRWRRCGSILEGMHFADTTLVEHAGKWWLFTCAARSRKIHNRDELFLYYSDDPTAGCWTPHPQNPVVADTRVARPAGNITAMQGRLYRPSQDNSARYGYGLQWNRIEQMDETVYREKTIGSLQFDQKATGIAGVHTYNQVGDWTVIDLLRWFK